MDKLLIDLLGTGIEIAVVMLFYGTFWEMKRLKWPVLTGGLVFVAAVNVAVTTCFPNEILLPIVSVVIICSLSFYFISNITSKILLGLVITASIFVIEMLVSIVLVQILDISIEGIQNTFSSYLLGVLTSKIGSLFLIYLIRFFLQKNKEQADRQFNLLMAFMPAQSILTCFIVYEFTSSIENPRVSALGLVAMTISLCLVFITMFVFDKQRKALVYKKKYEVSQFSLETQIDHYQKLYRAQREVRAIRHEMNNNLLAISGMLAEGRVQDALERIEGIRSDVGRTHETVDTGLPAVDAVLNAKISRAGESDIRVVCEILLEGHLTVDQFDLAAVAANALDNAIEGILRSGDVKKEILLRVTNTSGNVSVLVENFAVGPMDADFRSSKPDKVNHGFGLAQMKSIARKYNGVMEAKWDPKNGKFSLEVLLQGVQD